MPVPWRNSTEASAVDKPQAIQVRDLHAVVRICVHSERDGICQDCDQRRQTDEGLIGLFRFQLSGLKG